MTVPGSPPLFLRYLSDHQLGGVASFVDVHGYCDVPEFDLSWDESLSVVLAVEISCPLCCESRTYTVERG